MRISDWSSDVCSSDLRVAQGPVGRRLTAKYQAQLGIVHPDDFEGGGDVYAGFSRDDAQWAWWKRYARSEEHTSELQSLMRISYAVFCLKKNKTQQSKNLPKRTNNTE